MIQALFFIIQSNLGYPGLIIREEFNVVDSSEPWQNLYVVGI